MSSETSPTTDEPQSNSDATDLNEQRIAEIADAVADELEERDETPETSRRSLLKRMAAGGAMAAVGFGGTQAAVEGSTEPAQAQSASGSVGTSDNPVDVYGGLVDADEVVTGNPGRKMVSEGTKTITVGTDQPTIQDAVDQIPVVLQHEYQIDIPDGDYSAEDVTVPAFMTQAGDTSAGFLLISGNRTTPSNVKVGSMHIPHASGKRPISVRGLQLQRNHPDSDGGNLQYSGPSGMTLWDMEYRDVDNEGGAALIAYGGKMILKGTHDIGTDLMHELAVVKNFGQFLDATIPNDGDILGSTTAWGISNQNSAYCSLSSETSLTYATARYSHQRMSGMVYDSASGGSAAPWFDSLGVREVAGSSASDLDDREVVIDSGTGSLALKDAAGNFNILPEKQIETGTWDHPDPGTAGDGTWDSYQKVSTSISFSKSWSSAPIVVADTQQGGGSRGKVAMNNVTASGFDLEYFQYRSDVSASGTIGWIAIEQ